MMKDINEDGPADAIQSDADILAAVTAGDFRKALRLTHAKALRIASEIAPLQAASNQDQHGGRWDAPAESRIAWAARLVEDIHTFDTLMSELGGLLGDGRLALYGLLCGSIGCGMGLLGLDHAEVSSVIPQALGPPSADRLKAGGGAPRHVWQQSALDIARTLRSDDPSISTTTIARHIRKTLAGGCRTLPKLDHLAGRILPGWERRGLLVPRRRGVPPSEILDGRSGKPG